MNLEHFVTIYIKLRKSFDSDFSIFTYLDSKSVTMEMLVFFVFFVFFTLIFFAG